MACVYYASKNLSGKECIFIYLFIFIKQATENKKETQK